MTAPPLVGCVVWSLFGNMFIYIMVHNKFDRHIILYIIGVYTGWCLKSIMFCISCDYNIYRQLQFTATPWRL